VVELQLIDQSLAGARLKLPTKMLGKFVGCGNVAVVEKVSTNREREYKWRVCLAFQKSKKKSGAPSLRVGWSRLKLQKSTW
jgi:hypothetical protein